MAFMTRPSRFDGRTAGGIGDHRAAAAPHPSGPANGIPDVAAVETDHLGDQAAGGGLDHDPGPTDMAWIGPAISTISPRTPTTGRKY